MAVSRLGFIFSSLTSPTFLRLEWCITSPSPLGVLALHHRLYLKCVYKMLKIHQHKPLGRILMLYDYIIVVDVKSHNHLKVPCKCGFSGFKRF